MATRKAGTRTGSTTGVNDARMWRLGKHDLRFNDRALDRLLNGPQGPIATALLAYGAAVEREAKRLCPVDTGRLRASITHALIKKRKRVEVLVGTDVEYAKYVEFGNQGRYAYLRPALFRVARRSGGRLVVTRAGNDRGR